MITARGAQRAQLKWLSYAAVLFVLTFAVQGILEPQLEADFPMADTALQALGAVTFAAIPTSIGIAILRYRPYDIDVLINHTVVYGATSAAIAVTFFAGIVVLQAVLRPLTSGSELAVAGSTLVSFALFQPIRRRVQNAADRASTVPVMTRRARSTRSPTVCATRSTWTHCARIC